MILAQRNFPNVQFASIHWSLDIFTQHLAREPFVSTEAAVEQSDAGALFPGVVARRAGQKANRRQTYWINQNKAIAIVSDIIPSECDVGVEENSNFLRVPEAQNMIPHSIQQSACEW